MSAGMPEAEIRKCGNSLRRDGTGACQFRVSSREILQESSLHRTCGPVSTEITNLEASMKFKRAKVIYSRLVHIEPLA
jgi:hypothetical protein